MAIVDRAFMDKYDRLVEYIEKDKCTRHGLLEKTKTAMKLIILTIQCRGKDVLIRDIVKDSCIETQRVQKILYTLLEYDVVSKKEMSNVASKKKPIYGYTVNLNHPILKEG